MMPPKMPAATMPTAEPPAVSTPVASVASDIGASAGDGAAGAPSGDGGDETRAEPAATTVQDAGHVAASQPRSGEENAASSEQDRGSGQADAGMVQGAALEHAVTEIMSMGFSEADTRRALRMVRRMLHVLVLAGRAQCAPARQRSWCDDRRLISVPSVTKSCHDVASGVVMRGNACARAAADASPCLSMLVRATVCSRLSTTQIVQSTYSSRADRPIISLLRAFPCPPRSERKQGPFRPLRGPLQHRPTRGAPESRQEGWRMAKAVDWRPEMEMQARQGATGAQADMEEIVGPPTW